MSSFCAACGMRVNPKAGFCEHCGAVVGASAASSEPSTRPNAPPSEQKSENRRVLRLWIFIACVLLLLYIIYNTHSRTDTIPKPVEALHRITHISAKELVAAYKNNEILADRAYKGDRLVVHGTVGKIGKDILGTPYLMIDEEQFGLGGVQALFSDDDIPELATVSRGELVQVEGTCSGLMVNVLLRHCVLQSHAGR